MKFVRIFSKIRLRCIEMGNSNKIFTSFFIVEETIAYSSKITFTSKLSLCAAIKHLFKKDSEIYSSSYFCSTPRPGKCVLLCR